MKKQTRRNWLIGLVLVAMVVTSIVAMVPQNPYFQPSRGTSTGDPTVSGQQASTLKPEDVLAKMPQKFFQPSKQHRRVLPKREFKVADIQILTSPRRIDEIPQWMDEFKSRPEKTSIELGMAKEAVWNPYQPPATQKEYDLFMDEMEVFALHTMERSAELGSQNDLRIAAGGYMLVQILKQMEFKGYSAKGGFVLDISKSRLNALMNGQTYSQRVPAADEENNDALPGAANEYETLAQQSDSKEEVVDENTGDLTEIDTDVDLETDGTLYGLDREFELRDDELEAIKKMKGEQTSYHAETPARQRRSKAYTKGDPLSAGDSTGVLDSLIGSTSKIPGVSVSPIDFHRDNLELIDDIIDDARDYPADYGIAIKKDGTLSRSINDITDIELSVVLREIYHDRALTAALWGGLGSGLFGLFGAVIGDAISKMRQFGLAIVQSLGPSTIATVINAYQGYRQMYVMHRYYSYLQGIRYAAEITSTKYNPREHTISFDPNSVVFDRKFSQENHRVWLLGLAGGFTVRNVFSQKNVAKYLNSLTEKALTVMSKEAPSRFAGLLLRPVAGLFASVMTASSVSQLIASSAFGRMVTKLFAAPSLSMLGGKAGASSKYLGKATHLLKLIPGAGLVVFAADVIITGFFVYVTTFAVLNSAGLALERTLSSPGSNIYLAVATQAKDGRNFKEASRDIMYPLCAHIAVKSMNTQRTKESIYRIRRQRACKNLIMSLEGLSDSSELAQFGEEMAQMINSEQTLYVPADHEEQYKQLVREAYHMPESYKVVWLGALRSILPLDFVPQLYWETYLRIIVKDSWNWYSPMSWGRSEDAWEVDPSYSSVQRALRYGPTKPATMFNSGRLNYVLEELGTDMFLQSNEGKTAEDAALDVKSFENAYLAYFKFHQDNARVSLREIEREMNRPKVEGWWDFLSNWEILAGLGRQMTFWMGRVLKEPYEESSLYLGRQEIHRIQFGEDLTTEEYEELAESGEL